MRTLCLLLLLLLPGCSRAPMSPQETERVSQDITNKFADSLIKRDVPGAYALTSRDFHDRINQQHFDHFYEDAKFKHEVNPDHFKSDVASLPDAAAGKKLGIPDTIPRESWRAWTVVAMTQGNKGFSIGMLIVDEAGQLKIGHLKYGELSRL